MRRIIVVGTSGAGKSTLAAQIATRLDIPFTPTDPFYWQADWRPASIEHVDRLLDEVLSAPEWVLDGNFEHRWEQVWPMADCVIWLDYSLTTVLWRVTIRNLAWVVQRKPVWCGTRMSLRRAVSGIRHTFRSYAGKQYRYLQYATALATAGTPLLRFRAKVDAANWIATLPLLGFPNRAQRPSAAL